MTAVPHVHTIPKTACQNIQIAALAGNLLQAFEVGKHLAVCTVAGLVGSTRHTSAANDKVTAIVTMYLLSIISLLMNIEAQYDLASPCKQLIMRMLLGKSNAWNLLVNNCDHFCQVFWHNHLLQSRQICLPQLLHS